MINLRGLDAIDFHPVMNTSNDWGGGDSDPSIWIFSFLLTSNEPHKRYSEKKADLSRPKSKLSNPN